jgi:hypothetical protein
MSHFGTHYEQAFASYLEHLGLPYVPVDQARKAVFAGVSLKSFDFIVYGKRCRVMLADVKGRKLPWATYQRGRFGQNWTTADDVRSLHDWQQVFGAGHVAVFVFAYWLYDKAPDDQTSVLPGYDGSGWASYQFDHRDYIFVVARLDDYSRRMQTRSEKWQTVFVPTVRFAQIAQPFEQFIRMADPSCGLPK